MPTAINGPNSSARLIEVDENGIVAPIPNPTRYKTLLVDPVGGSRHVFVRLGTSALTPADVEVWEAWRFVVTVGVVDVGDTYRVTLAGDNFDYIALGGDTDEDIAEELKLLIDADEDYSASRSGAVVTIEPADGETTYTAATSMLATGGGTGTISDDTPIKGGDQFAINGYPEPLATRGATHVGLKTEAGQTATVAIKSTQRVHQTTVSQ